MAPVGWVALFNPTDPNSKYLEGFMHKRPAILHILAASLRRLVVDNHVQRAASLSYTTLLSLVPLISTSVSLLAIFPFFNHFIDAAQNYLQENFLPASSGAISTQLQGFVAHATKLPILSILSLLVTSVLLIFTVEDSLNAICQAPRRNKKIRAVLLHWLALVSMPIFIGAGLVFSSYLFSLSWFGGVAETIGVKIYLLASLPLLINTIILTFLYRMVPNYRISWRKALVGGFVAAVLFEIGKRGFGIYIAHFSDYQLIYGALATIPIFLVWIYLSWLIILYGMLIVHTSHELSTPSR
jgi:membrane protein